MRLVLSIHAPEKVAEGYLSSILSCVKNNQFEKRHLEIHPEKKEPHKEEGDKDELDQKMAEIELEWL